MNYNLRWPRAPAAAHRTFPRYTTLIIHASSLHSYCLVCSFISVVFLVLYSLQTLFPSSFLYLSVFAEYSVFCSFLSLSFPSFFFTLPSSFLCFLLCVPTHLPFTFSVFLTSGFCSLFLLIFPLFLFSLLFFAPSFHLASLTVFVLISFSSIFSSVLVHYCFLSFSLSFFFLCTRFSFLLLHVP